MTDLLVLADRVEKLTGPDRRLDALIDCAIRFPDLRPARPDDHEKHHRGFPPGQGDIWCPTGFLMARSYTRSVDDVLTLLPDGLEFEFTNLYGVAAVGIGLNTESPCYARREDGNITLALLAAILRARQAADTEGQS